MASLLNLISFSSWRIFEIVDLKFCLPNAQASLGIVSIIFPCIWVKLSCFFAYLIIFLLKTGHFEYYNAATLFSFVLGFFFF